MEGSAETHYQRAIQLYPKASRSTSTSPTSIASRAIATPPSRVPGRSSGSCRTTSASARPKWRACSTSGRYREAAAEARLGASMDFSRKDLALYAEIADSAERVHAPMHSVNLPPPVDSFPSGRELASRNRARRLPLAVGLAMGLSLRNGFVYDDVPAIVQNPRVTDPALWHTIPGSVLARQSLATGHHRGICGAVVARWRRTVGLPFRPAGVVSRHGAAAIRVHAPPVDRPVPRPGRCPSSSWCIPCTWRWWPTGSDRLSSGRRSPC